MTLADASPGKKYVIVDIAGGRRVYQYLYDLGIVPGSVVEIISTSFFRGPIRIRVGGTDVALGRGVALKVIVKEA